MICAKELLLRLEHIATIESRQLAAQMELTPRRFRGWWKRLNVPPTVPGHASHRWSEQDAQKLLSKWSCYWKKRNGHKK